MSKDAREFVLEEKVKGNETIVWMLRNKWTENLLSNVKNYLQRKRYIAPTHRTLAEELVKILEEHNTEAAIQSKAKLHLNKIGTTLEPEWNLRVSFLDRLRSFAEAQLKIIELQAEKLQAAEDRYILKYQEKNKELIGKIAQLEKEIAEKTNQLKKADATKDDLDDTIEHFQSQTRSLQQKIQQLEKELRHEKETYETSFNESQSRMEDIKRLNIENTNLSIKISEYESENKKLKSEISQFSSKKLLPMEVTKVSVKDKQTIKQLREQISDYDEKLKTYTNLNYEQVIEENKALRLEVIRLGDENSNLKSLNEKLTEQLKEKTTRLEQHAAHVSELSKQLHETKIEADESKFEVKRLTAILIKLKSWIYSVFGNFGLLTNEDTCDLIQDDRYNFSKTQTEGIKRVAIANQLGLSDDKINEYVQGIVPKIKKETEQNKPRSLEERSDEFINNFGDAVSSKVKGWFGK